MSCLFDIHVCEYAPNGDYNCFVGMKNVLFRPLDEQKGWCLLHRRVIGIVVHRVVVQVLLQTYQNAQHTTAERPSSTILLNAEIFAIKS